MSELDSIIIETREQPDAAVIWLHGLGADGSDFVPIVEQLQLPSHYAFRFIFPHAPVRPITINQGYQMPGWYDISSLSIVEQEDEAGIKESSAILKQLCEAQEASGIDSSRIIVAGFSQGGAIALHCGCRYPDHWQALWRCQLICLCLKRSPMRSVRALAKHPYLWRMADRMML